MKTLKLTSGLALILSLAFLSNCSPKLEDVSTTKEVLTQGKWSVNYYFNGQDRTDEFHGFQFNFYTSGALSATKDSSSYSGTWTIRKDDQYKDILTINLDNQAALNDLNSEWHVTTVGLNNVAMKDTTNIQLLFEKL
ncbi:MAG: hypothetical protein ACJ75B_00780 [Flavisolibacter sp.]